MLSAAHAAPQPDLQNEISALRAEAIENMHSGNVYAAINAYRRWAAIEPENPLVLKDLMFAQLQEGKDEETSQTALAVLRLRPDDTEAFDILLRLPQGENLAAVEKVWQNSPRRSSVQEKGPFPLYRKVLLLMPEDKALAALGHLRSGFYKTAQYQEGLEVAKYLAVRQPDEMDNWSWLAVFQLACGDPNISATYEKILRAEDTGKKEHPAQRILSTLYNSGDYKKALEVAAYFTKKRPHDAANWNWLGKVQNALGDGNGALYSYGKSLRLEPGQPAITVSIAGIYANQRKFAEAQRVCLEMVAAGNLPDKGYSILAHSLYWTGQYDKALPWWQKAVIAFPANLDYRYYQALTKNMLGQQAQALDEMRALYTDHKYQKALLFLADAAHLGGDITSEEALLEAGSETFTSKDEALVLRLCELYENSGNYDSEERLLNRFSQLVPESQPIWVQRAAVACHKENYSACEQFSQHVLSLNPYNVGIYKKLTDIALAVGRYDEALGYYRHALELDPTYAPAILDFARYNYEANRTHQAKAILADWLANNESSKVLPILLYHGLTTVHGDVLLAYSYHDTVDTFDSHLKALKDNGYSPVTQAQVEDWVYGKKDLPGKPVLLAFDDGRIDSFKLGDPVLRKYGMKATMFVPLVNVEVYSPSGYLPLTEIKKYQDTGRWEIQSHGDMAHIRVDTDKEGDHGLFLINRRWLPEQNRMETEAEWRGRIDKDYLSSRTKLETAMGHQITGFAYPEGSFGQKDDQCNEPESAVVNQELAHKYFRTAYIQDHFGENTRTRDPWHLERIEPDHSWNGEQLVGHLVANDPLVQAYAQLLEWATWEGRVRAAMYWLSKLEARGVARGDLLAGKAQIYLATGNAPKGLELAREAAALNAAKATEVLKSSTTFSRLSWQPQLRYETDSQSHHALVEDQSAEVLHSGLLVWSLRQTHGEYRQNGFSTAIDNAGGFAVGMPLGLFHHFSAELLSHRIGDTWSASGVLQSEWSGNLKTRLQASRSFYEVAAAIDSGINVDDFSLEAEWDHDGEGIWKASSRLRLDELSDGNRRLMAEAEVSRAIPSAPHLRAVYAPSYDDMKDFNQTLYYSPRGVLRNAFGAEVTLLDRKSLQWTLRALPALATERGGSLFLNAELSSTLSWHITSNLQLQPRYEYFSAPGYDSNSYSLQGSLRF